MSMEVAAGRDSAGDGTGIPFQVVSTGNSASSMGDGAVNAAIRDALSLEDLTCSGLNIACTGEQVAKFGFRDQDLGVFAAFDSDKPPGWRVLAACSPEALAVFPGERGSAAEREVLKRVFAAFCAEKIRGIPVHAIYWQVAEGWRPVFRSALGGVTFLVGGRQGCRRSQGSYALGVGGGRRQRFHQGGPVGGPPYRVFIPITGACAGTSGSRAQGGRRRSAPRPTPPWCAVWCRSH